MRMIGNRENRACYRHESVKQGTHLNFSKLMIALRLVMVRKLSGLKMSIVEKSATPVTAISLETARIDAKIPIESS